MCEGYGSRSVCLSVTKLAATYLVCKSKLRCYTIPYGIPNACIAWIPLKTFCSPVLASFADGKPRVLSLQFAKAFLAVKCRPLL